MEPSKLEAQLLDRNYFGKRLGIRTTLWIPAIPMIILGVISILWASFWAYFAIGLANKPLSDFWAELVDTDSWIPFFWWGGVIFTVFGIGFLVAGRIRQKRKLADYHERYLSDGYIAAQVPIGISESQGGVAGGGRYLMLLTHPKDTEQSVNALREEVQRHVEGLGEDGRVELWKQLRKAGGSLPVSQLWPEFAAQNLLTGNLTNKGDVVVVPSKDQEDRFVVLS